jgi:hypothetical protein
VDCCPRYGVIRGMTLSIRQNHIRAGTPPII